MDFQNQCLKAHNEYRQAHGVPPLVLSKDLCKVSQTWADTLSKRKTLEHSKNTNYGENIYCLQSSNPDITITGDKPVESWYDEIKVHKFGVEPTSLASGHFTQVIWKDSRELGVAFAKQNGRIVVVANYFPAGNVVGYFSRNVPPVGGFVENNTDPSEKLAALSLKAKTQPSPIKKTENSFTEGDFETDFLNAHNEYRKRHGVPLLKLDKKLCKISQEWAKNLADRNALEHRKNSPHGENIYCMYSSDPSFMVSGHAPVDSWYEEIKFHTFDKEPSSLKSGHFTQVVWKSSELLGVGVAKNRHNKVYVVANYSPAGNFVGDFVENVPPPLDNASKVVVREATSQSASKPKVEAVFEGNQFALEGLKVHNEYRRKHGVPELTLSKEVGRVFSCFALILSVSLISIHDIKISLFIHTLPTLTIFR